MRLSLLDSFLARVQELPGNPTDLNTPSLVLIKFENTLLHNLFGSKVSRDDVVEISVKVEYSAGATEFKAGFEAMHMELQPLNMSGSVNLDCRNE